MATVDDIAESLLDILARLNSDGTGSEIMDAGCVLVITVNDAGQVLSGAAKPDEAIEALGAVNAAEVLRHIGQFQSSGRLPIVIVGSDGGQVFGGCVG